jgi:hypothetical protein
MHECINEIIRGNVLTPLEWLLVRLKDDCFRLDQDLLEIGQVGTNWGLC